jgi:hypothetical protein
MVNAGVVLLAVLGKVVALLAATVAIVIRGVINCDGASNVVLSMTSRRQLGVSCVKNESHCGADHAVPWTHCFRSFARNAHLKRVRSQA